MRKDVTDGELAVDEALRRGAGELVLAGALGALDHTLGHLAILRRLAARGVAARLAAPHLAVRVLAAPAEARPRRAFRHPRLDRAARRRRGGDAAGSRLPARARRAAGRRLPRARQQRRTVRGAPACILHRGLVALLVESGAETFGGPGRLRRGLMRGPVGWRIAAAAVAAVIVVVGAGADAPGARRRSPARARGRRPSPGHFVEYAVLGFVLPVALRGWRPGGRVLLAAGLLCVGLGLSIELVQLVLPYRSAQVSDALVDAAGAALGLAARQLGRAGAGETITMASRMMLAATSSAGTS